MRHRMRLVIVCLVTLGLICLLTYRRLPHSSPAGNPAPNDPPIGTLPDTSGRDEVAQPNSSSHKPMDICENCHDSNTPDEAKAKELAQQVPRLCYTCHADESRTFAHVHGPVAVGQCLFCHDPHASEHPHLLKHNPPELCALCHTQADLASVADHQKPAYINCLDCHNSHASNERFLLKQSPLN